MNKYREIARTLQLRIVARDYRDRLPVMRELAAEFKVSLHTLDKALKMLAEDGLIESRGSQGIWINHERAARRGKGAGKIIGLCVSRKTDPERDIFIIELKRLIAQAGHIPLLIANNQRIFLDAKFWQTVQLDGVIFIYSSVDAKLLNWLNSRQIPVVAANRLAEGISVSWVDFDHEKHVSAIVAWLKAHNIRRIVLDWPNPKDELNHHWMSALWERILKRYDLPVYAENFIEYELSPANIRAQAGRIARLEPTPEAVICCHVFDAMLEKELNRSGLRIPILKHPIKAWSSREGDLDEAYRRLSQSVWSTLVRVMEYPYEIHQVSCAYDYEKVMGTVWLNQLGRQYISEYHKQTGGSENEKV